MKISATIKPNSRHREEIVENADGSLVIYTKAPAVEGKANAAAIKLVAERFKVPKSRVSLTRGATSKYKVFEIKNP